ncbi:hypothetical protein FJ959_18075 [Mesorhizobium sp. B2-2-4]|uniref:hypothetical protein n=1 Tax=unclassified Mesorhizobium TaxID=325217 RepID=UPI0011270DBF|nr:MULTISPECIES: hypothetical protein [unclassified Mesorhizobium]TPM55319.1 hypothetical protein FJ959_18075 [Mesorhizobium sp. B2-2-4]TPM66286.1 hypothetical protein FJ965_14035 [Mesorhizobium sp. B2-2-1]TPN59933.1 hypothetical protein FJ984_30960 [Mesorhizobium sp. B1-1-3]
MKGDLIAIRRGKPVIRCPNFPECRCGDDCTDRSDIRMVRLLFGLFITVTLAIGVGLIVLGLRS